MKGAILIAAILFAGLALFGCAAQSPSGGNMSIATGISFGGGQGIPAATSGQPYNAKITPSGGSPPYNCSAAPGTSLPGTLVFSEPGCSLTGGAPVLDPGTSTKTFPISFMIKDSKGNVGGPFHLDLVVNLPTVQFLFTAGALPSGAIGQLYTYSFCQPPTSGICGEGNTTNPTGGHPPYHFTLESGVGFPPAGITMDANGVLSGTPKAAGTSNFGVCAVDLSSNQKCASVSLTISGNPPRFTHYDPASRTFVDHLQPKLHPAIVSDSATYPEYRLVLDSSQFTDTGQGTGAEQFEQSYFIQGGTAPYSLNITGQPGGISIANGILGGKLPKGTNPGDYSVVICVTDSSGLSVCENTTLPVVKLDVSIDRISCKFSQNQYGGTDASASAAGSASTTDKDTHLTFESWTSGGSAGSLTSFGDETYGSDKTCPSGWKPYCLMGCGGEPSSAYTPLDQYPSGRCGSGLIDFDNGCNTIASTTDTCLPGSSLSGSWSYKFGDVYGIQGETVNLNITEFTHANYSESRNTVFVAKTAGCS
jgi:hypothetical protein